MLSTRTRFTAEHKQSELRLFFFIIRFSRPLFFFSLLVIYFHLLAHSAVPEFTYLFIFLPTTIFTDPFGVIDVFPLVFRACVQRTSFFTTSSSDTTSTSQLHVYY